MLLLSPALNLGKREEWEPVLFGEAEELGRQVAYVLLRPCKFPELFRKKAFFDLSAQRLGGMRALRRWILRRDPFFQRATNVGELPAPTGGPKALFELDHLLDEPGAQYGVDRELALRFARAHVNDFEGVFRVDCAYRSRAGILGDTAHALGMSLSGPVEENAQRLRALCSDHRLLLIVEHIEPVDAAFMAAGEKTSFLFVTEQNPPAPASLKTTANLFANWQTRCDECFAWLGQAQWHVRNLKTYDGESAKAAVSLGSAAALFLRNRDRLAEAYEFLEMTRDGLCARGDTLGAAGLDWEMSWIREEWGGPVAPRSRMLPAPPVQLSLGLWE